MALETLKGITKINGEEVLNVDNIPEFLARNGLASGKFIIHDKHSGLYFKIQNGPVREYGKNGCQVEDIIAVAKTIVQGLNKQFPCDENTEVIRKLEEAILWSKKRTADRIERQVEGLSKS